MKTRKVIGVMSGTSLDGLDLAYCEFDEMNYHFFKIHKAVTLSYSDAQKNELNSLFHSGALQYIKADKKFGEFIGQEINKFITANDLHPDLIASHGHTVFHQPENKLTAQIGDGSVIAAITGIPVVSNFRAADVALGGQGAPLVPVGDKLLFGDYDYCLNIGGIANISMERNGNRIAWDICPANMILNFLAVRMNLPFDRDGLMAASGKLNQLLLDKFNRWEYYHKSPPKSIGREAVDSFFISDLKATDMLVADALHTCCEHIAIQIGKVSIGTGKKMLVTGGGALNKYLVSRIRDRSEAEVCIPDKTIVDYKEALVFALLGLRRWNHEINCFASVTGASRDCSCGEVAFP